MNSIHGCGHVKIVPRPLQSSHCNVWPPKVRPGLLYPQGGAMSYADSCDQRDLCKSEHHRGRKTTSAAEPACRLLRQTRGRHQGSHMLQHHRTAYFRVWRPTEAQVLGIRGHS
jgi:hypothetical protein